MSIEIQTSDGLEFLRQIEDNSIHLILTDPPYIISKSTGMNTFYDKVNSKEGNTKTEEEWELYKKTLDKPKAELEVEEGKGWSKQKLFEIW